MNFKEWLDGGKLWSLIRGEIGNLREEMKEAVESEGYEIESAHLDGMARKIDAKLRSAILAKHEEAMAELRSWNDELQKANATFFEESARSQDKQRMEKLEAIVRETSMSDTERLDWLQRHSASVAAADDESCSCTVQSNTDYRIHGWSDSYDIREAIERAAHAEYLLEEKGGA